MILIEEIYNTWRAKACHYQRHSNKSIGYLRWEGEDHVTLYLTRREEGDVKYCEDIYQYGRIKENHNTFMH